MYAMGGPVSGACAAAAAVGGGSAMITVFISNFFEELRWPENSAWGYVPRT